MKSIINNYTDNILCDTTSDLKEPEQCDDSTLLTEPSKQCVHRYFNYTGSFVLDFYLLSLYLHGRYGPCVPFYPSNDDSPCIGLYETGVDYVYVPNTRNEGSLAQVIDDMTEFGLRLIQPLLDCAPVEIERLLCHYYHPPCGNATHFQPPTAVCPEVCNATRQMCPNEWATVVNNFLVAEIYINLRGLQFINCEFPGQHLPPFPHCCVDFGFNISEFHHCPI